MFKDAVNAKLRRWPASRPAAFGSLNITTVAPGAGESISGVSSLIAVREKALSIGHAAERPGEYGDPGPSPHCA
jgi:hypothetical protein